MTATLTIDLTAIAENWRTLDRLSGPATTAAVIKADAYGLGATHVAPALHRAGATKFFVAIASEGQTLRKILGPAPEIYIFAGYMPCTAETLRDNALIPLLNSPAQAAAFHSDLPNHPHGLQFDSGMNRLGLEPADLANLPALSPTLIISHLACADTPNHPQNAAQLSTFRDMTARFSGIPRSLAATGGTLLGSDYHFDLTRPGIGLYGGAPFTDARPVVTLSLPIIQIRDVAAGESVGYGASWTAQRPSRIATIAAGYADGLFRALGANFSLFHETLACPAIGRVSMDLITADVTDLPTEPTHLDILCPAQTIDQLATSAGTIGYEILTSLGPRYERIYKGAT